MAMMESAFGLAGVVWLTGAVVLATVVAVFLVARQYADPLPAVVVALMVVLATSDNLTGRPQVVELPAGPWWSPMRGCAWPGTCGRDGGWCR